MKGGENMSSILIKVARLGTQVQELALNTGATVASALESADLTIESEDVRVNNNAASESTVLNDGDIVTLVPKVKGGQKIVKVARLGTQVQEVAVPENASVQEALDAAGIDIDNEDVRLDGRSVNTTTSIGTGNLITIVPKVKGGK